MEQTDPDLTAHSDLPEEESPPLDLAGARKLAWIWLVALAVVQCWAGLFTLSPDGMSYLDLSDAVVAGHWGGLVNAYWSPLYPALIGVLRVLVGATPFLELAVIHVLNLLLFIGSIRAFEYFLAPLVRLATGWGRQDLERPRGRLAAYAFFGVFSLTMTPLTTPTPDLAISIAVYVAFGALLRLKESAGGDRRAAIALGVALGLGALAKSFLVPWSVVCLITLAIATRRSSGWNPTRTASLVWAIIVVPWCVVLSVHVGRPTFGETGRLAYVWAMNFDESPSSQGMPATASTPAVDSLLRGVGITPHAQGTNPVWFDPARWYGGLPVNWHAGRAAKVFASYLLEYVTAFAPLVVLLVLALLAADPTGRRVAWDRAWIIAIPVLTALTAYALVLVTTRYIAPFVIAGTLVMWLALRWPSRLHPRRVAAALAVGCCAIIAAPNGHPVIASQAGVFAAVLAAWVARRGSRERMVVVAVLAAVLIRVLTTVVPVTTNLFAFLLGLSLAAVAAGAIARSQAVELSRFVRTALAVTSAVVLGLAAGAKYLDSVFHVSVASSFGVQNLPYAIASDFRDRGLSPGTPIALIGSPFTAYWARVGRLQIVAAVPEPTVAAFWALPPEKRGLLLREFAKAGARVVVATDAPGNLNRVDSAWTPTRFHAWIQPLQPARR